MLPMNLHQLIMAGGVIAQEHHAATRAIEETRRFWLPILEDLAAQPDLGFASEMWLSSEIRRLRRALGLPPAVTEEQSQRRREQTRDRVRRHRARLKASLTVPQPGE
jgi:hypothetical protein